MNKTTLTLALTAVAAFAGGVGTGLFISKTRYKAIADDEIESVKQHYAAIHDKEPLVSPIEQQDGPPAGISAEALIALKEHMEGKGYVSDSEDPPEQQVMLSIFDETPPEELVVLNRLLAERDHQLPYVITYDEFMEDEPRFDKETLTYWEEDNTLMAADESVVPDIAGVLGGALSYFGIGSNDPSMVYVRVESSQTDFEVVKDPRSYSEIVHGYLEAEEKKPLGRMRDDE